MRPIFLLDVDGVLNAIHHQPGEDQFDDFQSTRILGFLITYSKKMGERIINLDADIVWLTSWQGNANQYIRHLFGWDPFPVVPSIILKTPWWKAEAAQWYLQGSERPFVWVDDDLNYGESVGALGWLTEYPQPHLVMTTTPTAGLRPSQLDTIEKWIGELWQNECA